MSPVTVICLMATLSCPKSSKQILAFAETDLLTLGFIKRDTIYKALPRLVKEKLFVKVESGSDINYQITSRGKMLLKAETRRMQDLSLLLRRLLQQNP